MLNCGFAILSTKRRDFFSSDFSSFLIAHFLPARYFEIRNLQKIRFLMVNDCLNLLSVSDS